MTIDAILQQAQQRLDASHTDEERLAAAREILQQGRQQQFGGDPDAVTRRIDAARIYSVVIAALETNRLQSDKYDAAQVLLGEVYAQRLSAYRVAAEELRQRSIAVSGQEGSSDGDRQLAEQYLQNARSDLDKAKAATTSLEIADGGDNLMLIANIAQQEAHMSAPEDARKIFQNLYEIATIHGEEKLLADAGTNFVLKTTELLEQGHTFDERDIAAAVEASNIAVAAADQSKDPFKIAYAYLRRGELTAKSGVTGEHPSTDDLTIARQVAEKHRYQDIARKAEASLGELAQKMQQQISQKTL